MAGSRVIVLGGGISGLAASWRIATSHHGAQVTLIEASNRTGGWIQSYKSPNGAIFEAGPRSLRVAGNAARSTMGLISELGLESSVLPITSSHPAQKNRFIYLNDQGLVLLPNGPSWVFRARPPFSKPLLGVGLAEPFKRGADWGQGRDESVKGFVTRRFNAEIAEYLFDPMCRGIFAGRSDQLSVRSCFPQLFEFERDSGSVVRGMLFGKKGPKPASTPLLVQRARREKWSIYSLKNGTQELVDALHTAVSQHGVEVKLNSSCTGLQFSSDPGPVTVSTSGGGSLTADHVISCLPSSGLAKLLPPCLNTLRDTLSAIPTVSVAVVNLEFSGRNILPAQFEHSFGYLVPSHQPSDILGVVNDSGTFPEHDRRDLPSTRLTVMLGGAWFEELFGSPEADTCASRVESAAVKAVTNHLGITQDPSLCNVLIQKDCIPQYHIGHQQKLGILQEQIELHKLPLTLLGSSYHGVSVNDCIHNALNVKLPTLGQQ